MEEMGGGQKTEKEACLYLPGVHLPAIPRALLPKFCLTDISYDILISMT